MQHRKEKHVIYRTYDLLGKEIIIRLNAARALALLGFRLDSPHQKSRTKFRFDAYPMLRDLTT